MSQGHVDTLIELMYNSDKLIERVLLSQTLFIIPKKLRLLRFFFASLRLTSAAEVVLVVLYTCLEKSLSVSKQKNWARELSKAVIDAKTMHQLDWIDTTTYNKSKDLKETFDFRVPNQFKAQIDKHPELAVQFVPSVKELEIKETELNDPIGDETHSPVEGVTHRYEDRVLLKLSHQCASYCRFCFRKYKVSDESFNLSDQQLESALDYIQDTKNIREVIFTGGDPLSLTDKKIFPVLDKLNSMTHIKSIRFHTRIVTVLPSRITQELCKKLESLQKSVYLVVHANSHLEFNQETDDSIRLLKRAGVSLLSQSVLLRQVNDSEEKLKKLMQAFMERGIVSYYLHYPDLAKGTSHFRIDLKAAMELVSSLRSKLPGYAIPELIIDIPGGKGKIPAFSSYLQVDASSNWFAKSPIDASLTPLIYQID